MTKKRKIILISLAVTLALSVGVGGLVYANYGLGPHEDGGGNKLLGVGEMGMEYEDSHYYPVTHNRSWDTQFIITNPNCEQELTIEWVALIESDEDVIFEGTPEDWFWCPYTSIDIPSVLSGHEVFQVSIAELIAGLNGAPSSTAIREDWSLDKYTLEVTWSGARYTGWWWWGYWRSGRPLTGWAKEKCWNWYNVMGDPNLNTLNMSISEAEMKVFPSRRPFSPPDWWDPMNCMLD